MVHPVARRCAAFRSVSQVAQARCDRVPHEWEVWFIATLSRQAASNSGHFRAHAGVLFGVHTYPTTDQPGLLMESISSVTRVMPLFSASPDPYYHILAEPLHPLAVAFLRAWRAESSLRELVAGKDILSHPFARFLSNLMTVEPIDNDTDGRIRNAGRALRYRYGRDVTNVRFSQLFTSPGAADNLMRLREVRRTGTPIVFSATILRARGPALCYESVFLRILAPDERTYWNIVGIFMRDA